VFGNCQILFFNHCFNDKSQCIHLVFDKHKLVAGL
jgi:hypothetical protein